MAYIDYYYLENARKAQNLARPHILEGKSMRWTWINVQIPVWHVSYSTYIKMLSETNLDERIEEARPKKKHFLRKRYW